MPPLKDIKCAEMYSNHQDGATKNQWYIHVKITLFAQCILPSRPFQLFPLPCWKAFVMHKNTIPYFVFTFKVRLPTSFVYCLVSVLR